MAIYALSGELVFTKSGVGNNINIGDQRSWLEKKSIELRSLLHKAGIRKLALEPDARRRFNGATHLHCAEKCTGERFSVVWFYQAVP